MPTGSLSSLWSDVYAPKCESDLHRAVDKRRVGAVEDWLRDAMRPFSPRKLLCLTGPTGAGKTQTVRILAAKLGMRVVEWVCPTSCRASDIEGKLTTPYQHELGAFRDFLLRSNRYAALGAERDASFGQQQSQAQLILVEDLPQLFNSEQQETFASAVSAFLERSRFPLILIVSDESQETPSLWRYLPPKVLAAKTPSGEAKTHTIRFNPVTDLRVQKLLREILLNESVGTQLSQPDLIASIVASCHGDLRQGIQTLQLMCFDQEVPGFGDRQRHASAARALLQKFAAIPDNPMPLQSSSSAGGGSNGKSSSGPSKFQGQRDLSVGLFHALGKVLHGTKSKQLDFEHIIDQQLSPDVERRFTDFLFGNYLRFAEQVEDTEAVLDAFSDSDILLREAYSTFEGVTPTLENCSRHIVARRLADKDRVPEGLGFKSLYKPHSITAANTREAYRKTTRDLFTDTYSLPGIELATLVLPFAEKILSYSVSRHWTAAQLRFVHILCSYSDRTGTRFNDWHTPLHSDNDHEAEPTALIAALQPLLVDHLREIEHRRPTGLSPVAEALVDDIED